MRQLELEEIKKIQLEILDDIVAFCDENDIKYWIDYGTLLGAVRHEGYIPWDDDVDVGMLREDYDRFLRLYNQREGSCYSVHTVELDKNYYFPYAKVHDDRTVLYSPDINGKKFAVNVDIFPYDDAPLTERAYKKMHKWQERFFMLDALRNTKDHMPSGNRIRKLAVNALILALKLFPSNYFVGCIAKNAVSNKDKRTPYISTFVAAFDGRADKHIFDEMIELPFEQKRYKAPSRYDEWLTILYGDYMTPPPVEKRGTNHNYIAFMKE